MSDLPTPLTAETMSAEAPITMTAEQEAFDRAQDRGARFPVAYGTNGTIDADLVTRAYAEIDAQRARIAEMLYGASEDLDVIRMHMAHIKELEAGNVTSDEGTALNWKDELAAAHRRIGEVEKDREALIDALEFAWVVIANAGGGDWTRETEDWQDAAKRFHDMPGMAITFATKAEEVNRNTLKFDAVHVDLPGGRPANAVRPAASRSEA